MRGMAGQISNAWNFWVNNEEMEETNEREAMAKAVIREEPKANLYQHYSSFARILYSYSTYLAHIKSKAFHYYFSCLERFSFLF